MSDIVLAGEKLCTEGNFEAAEKVFRDALEVDPKNKEILNNLGVSLYSQNKLGQAATYFAQALSIDPFYLDAIVNYCQLLQATESLASGLPLLEVAIQKFPDHDELQNLHREAQKILQNNNLTATSDEPSGTSDETIEEIQDAVISDSERIVLDLIEANDTDTPSTVMQALIQADEISFSLVSKLATWMDNTQIFKSYRDVIEEQISLKCNDDTAVKKYAHRENMYRPPSYVVPGFETYPRRIITSAEANDPFMQEVPESAPSKKNGMRILVISDFNIAGQHTRLMRSLNKYTQHMARCVIYQDDYLSYDRDVLINDQQGKCSDKDMTEAADLIKKADFFHIGRQLMPINDIQWEKYVSSRNALFQYHGSHLRNNGPAIADFHARNGFEAVTCVDWSIYKKLQTSFYHLHPCILDRDEVPVVERDYNGTIKLCHAPAGQNYRKNKRSDLIIDTMNRVSSEIENVESVIIENVPNHECLRLKSECHIHIVSLLMAFGLNAIESAAMGLVPVTTLDNFTRFIYYDTPVVHATKSNVYEVVKKLVADPIRLEDLGKKCQEWAWSKFDARLVARQYAYLYDLVYNGLSVDYQEVVD